MKRNNLTQHYKRTGINYKQWAKEFFEEIKTHEWNTVHYYRFTLTGLYNFLNYTKRYEQDLVQSHSNAVISSMIYHMKKLGFKKTHYPNEYKLLKELENDKRRIHKTCINIFNDFEKSGYKRKRRTRT